MRQKIANEKLVEEVKRIKSDDGDIENRDILIKNEIAKTAHREAMKFIKLFHKSVYGFHENRIKKEEVIADAGLEFTCGAISNIVSKIVAKIRSLINVDRDVKKRPKKATNTKNQTF